MGSTEELLQSLESYNIQLETVDTALTTDPENEELLVLKKDLQEVISLTKDLIDNAEPNKKKAEVIADVSQSDGTVIEWKPGDECTAMSSEDGRYYKAYIDNIDDEGKVNVTFVESGNNDITEMSLLKPITDMKATRQNKPASDVQQTLPYAATSGTQPLSTSGDKKPMTKRERMIAEREYKKKKAQKKRERLQKLEEQKEEEKNKWLQFNQKTMLKSKRGKSLQMKRSIFASPESVAGRVGVGTCGTSDRPMTKNPSWDKHRMYKPQM